MARFIKHVGKHGDRKVAVIFREIPGEPHMCLVVYTELLNQNIHDPLIACIESPQGQAAENLGEALSRAYTKDGQIILNVLHREGMMKKAQTGQVMMTPSPNTKIKLEELNKILNEMATGEEAVKRLAEIDASRGLQDPADVAKRMRGESTIDSASSLLADSQLAQQRLAQAQKMALEAKGLLAESQRLEQEAYAMDPKLNPVAEAAPAPAKRGRKPKNAASVG